MMFQFIKALLLGNRCARAICRQIPIATDFQFSCTPLQYVARREFTDAFKNAVRIRYVTEVEVLQQSLAAQLGKFRTDGKNRFDLGGEEQLSLMNGVVQGLLAEAVTR